MFHVSAHFDLYIIKLLQRKLVLPDFAHFQLGILACIFKFVHDISNYYFLWLKSIIWISWKHDYECQTRLRSLKISLPLPAINYEPSKEYLSYKWFSLNPKGKENHRICLFKVFLSYKSAPNDCSSSYLCLAIDRRIRYEALQSESGKKLLRRSGRAPDDISSVVLVEKDRYTDIIFSVF